MLETVIPKISINCKNFGRKKDFFKCASLKKLYEPSTTIKFFQIFLNFDEQKKVLKFTFVNYLI